MILWYKDVFVLSTISVFSKSILQVKPNGLIILFCEISIPEYLQYSISN